MDRCEPKIVIKEQFCGPVRIRNSCDGTILWTGAKPEILVGEQFCGPVPNPKYLCGNSSVVCTKPKCLVKEQFRGPLRTRTSCEGTVLLAGANSKVTL